MNKKILIISLVIIVAILVVGFFVFGNFKTANAPEQKIETIPQNTEIPKDHQPEVKIDAPEIKTEDQKSNDGFYVCQDKCGDGICQPAGTICKDQLNCICAETKDDCPQDCKN